MRRCGKLSGTGLFGVFKAQKPGTNWRWEERGAWWMCTAAPGFGRGDRPGRERQPLMEGHQRGEDRQIAPGGARSLHFGRDDREDGRDKQTAMGRPNHRPPGKRNLNPWRCGELLQM